MRIDLRKRPAWRAKLARLAPSHPLTASTRYKCVAPALTDSWDEEMGGGEMQIAAVDPAAEKAAGETSSKRTVGVESSLAMAPSSPASLAHQRTAECATTWSILPPMRSITVATVCLASPGIILACNFINLSG
eukprot:CAMPEP_0119338138 /NCGR_PEP_ID=MMETSP1333-20130426/95429_1 /TAXON_ID=418940 /ORGANISM="Scyphosphaera apsteinii, Strain RCC1455" /LENGTH=132 /DNA_ID=CAMNT_0007349347 /DNA_START=868 /DNA_END=1267 /DNA_ORIENTATION=+